MWRAEGPGHESKGQAGSQLQLKELDALAAVGAAVDAVAEAPEPETSPFTVHTPSSCGVSDASGSGTNESSDALAGSIARSKLALASRHLSIKLICWDAVLCAAMLVAMAKLCSPCCVTNRCSYRPHATILRDSKAPSCSGSILDPSSVARLNSTPYALCDRKVPL